MKKLFVLIAFVAAIVTAVAGQQLTAARPTASQNSAPTGDFAPFHLAQPGTPPPICNPCLFYGGDINPSDPNAQGFVDENTLLIPLTETLGAVIVPAGEQAVVKGLLFNVVPLVDDFDPKTATWEIRTGLSEGNGGTQIASGSGNASIVPTGRIAFGLNEYTVSVAVSPALKLTPGTYWVNVTPQCTNSGDEECSGDEGYYLDNTTQGTNNVRGHLQPLHEMYLNSAYFGYTYTNWCDSSLGQNQEQCAAGSFGAIGY